jgi:hypothetical protein
MRKLICLLFLASLAAAPTVAHADLTGDTLHGTYLYPDTSTVFDDLGTFVVPGSGIAPANGSLQFSVTGSQITILSLQPGTFQNASFNGFEFVDTTKNPLITAVTLDASSTFGVTGISFTGDSIFLNFAGITDNTGQKAIFDLTFGTAPTPEPSSIALLGTGALGLMGMVRRRFSR